MMCGKRDVNAERDWQRDRQSEKVERGREKRGEWERNKGAERESTAKFYQVRSWNSVRTEMISSTNCQ